jgi:hypothetical protein
MALDFPPKLTVKRTGKQFCTKKRPPTGQPFRITFIDPVSKKRLTQQRLCLLFYCFAQGEKQGRLNRYSAPAMTLIMKYFSKIPSILPLIFER